MLYAKSYKITLCTLLSLATCTIFCADSDNKKQNPSLQYNAPEAIQPNAISLQADCEQLFKASPAELQEFVALLKCDPMPTHLLPRGFIFCGPPGTGKTELARALAIKSGFLFYKGDQADFGSPFHNSTIKNLKSIFDKIDSDLNKSNWWNRPSGAILFMDEFESIVRSRSARSSFDAEDSKSVSFLLSAIDGLTKHKRPIIIVGATNRLDMIDYAIKSRLKVLYIGPPTEANRLKALQTLNPQYFKHDWKLDQAKLKLIAQNTNGMSYRDLVDIVKRCAVHSYLYKKLSIENIYEIIKEQRHATGSTHESLESLFESIYHQRTTTSQRQTPGILSRL